MTTLQLGRTDIRISPMGVGTWAWGDSFGWGYGHGYSAGDVEAAFDVSVRAGISFFDTAEVYARGRSEEMLGDLLQRKDVRAVIATKYAPWRWRALRPNVHGALRRSLTRLGLPCVDLYQLHWPSRFLSTGRLAKALSREHTRGLLKAAGISNYPCDRMLDAERLLQGFGLSLASNQVHYNLLHRAPERDGTLEACKQHGITMIAYSPLGMGTLTGKYSPDHRPHGVYRLRYRGEVLDRLPPLLGLMRELGEAHGRRTLSQVALNWVMRKGAVPIPGAKNSEQAEENAGALGWELTGDEVSALDRASESVQV